MTRLLRSNGLSVVMFGLAAIFVFGLSVAGARQHDEDHAWGGARAYSEEQEEHGGAAVSVPA